MYWENMVSDDATGGYTWEEWAEIADFVESIDFGCQFDENGCKRAGERGCCASCSDGYLHKIPIEALETVKRECDKNDGFWRSSGCALPAKWRSRSCLSFYCDDSDENDSDEEVWEAFRELFHKGGICLETIRTKMQTAGLLKQKSLVSIS